jgi:hypothetical protein
MAYRNDFLLSLPIRVYAGQTRCHVDGGYLVRVNRVGRRIGSAE